MEASSLQYFTIGDSIRQYRNKANLTQSQLAELSGVSTGYISKIENDEVERPSFEKVSHIAKALQIPIHEIVQPYLEIRQKSNVLFGILREVIKEDATDLIVKVASACLHSKDMDSIDLMERLYEFVDLEVTSDSLKLVLYDLIIRQSRGHGINKFAAKALFQKYLIERNDFTKLHATYDSGRYVLHYVDFLSAEERVSLYYKLGVHAYNLRLFQESIDLCMNNVAADISVSLLKAESVGILTDSYYYLGHYDLCEKYLQQYMTFPYPHIKDNAKLMTAVLHAKKGNKALALAQLEECLQSCGDNALLHVIKQLMIIYLEKKDWASIEKLFRWEEKVISIPCHTPYKKSELAHYYKLKGDYCVSVGNIEIGAQCYLESASWYSKVNDKLNERSSHLMMKLVMEKDERMDIEIIKKFQNIFDQCMKYELR
ncbi:helix-turn-helix domain-containing protein [Paenibacillus thiaminolyticus]|uniref:helix-turn-helix domain-containing protein n=1 Tax=Paenibacillus thiaminolyticus TaxID=49283 RepID=UPI00232F23AE|nr:helix-turn-helix domain-containing protein [Paenibacillus thiaminolyticus]WCF07361.1 helix-turn-helix domain-containing protein [Paenibacillus thiaminolyticus]